MCFFYFVYYISTLYSKLYTCTQNRRDTLPTSYKQTLSTSIENLTEVHKGSNIVEKIVNPLVNPEIKNKPEKDHCKNIEDQFIYS